MKVTGKKGIGEYLKIILQICFIGGIIILVSLPLILILLGKHINAFAYVLYPNAICFLYFMKQFIELFDALKQNKPFCEDTVKRLNNAGRAAGLISVILGVETIFDLLMVKDEILYVFALGFICILFFGVSIALYILSELFRQAKDYKEENDLTV